MNIDFSQDLTINIDDRLTHNERYFRSWKQYSKNEVENLIENDDEEILKGKTKTKANYLVRNATVILCHNFETSLGDLERYKDSLKHDKERLYRMGFAIGNVSVDSNENTEFVCDYALARM